MRLIDADEAIINFGFEWDDISPTRDEFVEFIKKQPTTESEPVKHGRWIDAYPDIEPNPMFMYGICSECGFEQGISKYLNYCPNCGAKMESEG